MTWYHGTRAGFRRGGYLFPADWHGKAVRAGTTDTSVVYITEDFDLAAWYAVQGKGRGRPKVLTVQPLGPIRHDASPYDGEQDDQFMTESAKVLAVTFVDETSDDEPEAEPEVDRPASTCSLAGSVRP